MQGSGRCGGAIKYTDFDCFSVHFKLLEIIRQRSEQVGQRRQQSITVIGNSKEEGSHFPPLSYKISVIRYRNQGICRNGRALRKFSYFEIIVGSLRLFRNR